MSNCSPTGSANLGLIHRRSGLTLSAWSIGALLCWIDWNCFDALFWREARWPAMALVFSVSCVLADRSGTDSSARRSRYSTLPAVAPPVVAFWLLSKATETFFGNLLWLQIFHGPALDAVLLCVLGATVPYVLAQKHWGPSMDMVALGFTFAVPAIALVLLVGLVVRFEGAYIFPGANVIIYMSFWGLAGKVAIKIRDTTMGR